MVTRVFHLQGGRFNVIPLFLNIGSGLALLGIVSKSAEFAKSYFIRLSSVVVPVRVVVFLKTIFSRTIALDKQLTPLGSNRLPKKCFPDSAQSP